MNYNINDLTNKKFGRLLVLEKTNKRQDGGSIVWKCRCDCGNIVEISSKRLVSNVIKSCGCLQRERQKYSMSKLHSRQLVNNTNIDLILKKDPNKNNKTGVRGVHWCQSKKRWIATLNFQKRLLLNKTCKTKEEAIQARKKAEEEYFKLN